ncbi:MAG: hypothetical protein IJ538_03815 [Clostridia bacterium]|nr:hypothetical protein [Clostridia bacterium]
MEKEKFDWNYYLEKYPFALPADPILADLYAFSREIKSVETDTTQSTNKHSNTFFMNGFGQISFMTPGCKLGQCSFCSYGAGKNPLMPLVVAHEMDKFTEEILNRDQETYAILLDSVGSILDKNEFSPECLEMVFKKLDELLLKVKTIEAVEFETHYQTLGSYDENGDYIASDAVNQLIAFKEKHPEIGTFVVELGFETSNGEVRDNLLFKHIDDETYKQSVELLHQHGIEVEANVMATLPFLSQKEQIAQSVSSVLKALKPYDKNEQPASERGYGIDSVTLFPLNVRKHTFCDYVFGIHDGLAEEKKKKTQTWMQKEFPIWSMVATLDAVYNEGEKVKKGYGEELLSRVSVAWFGGRQLSNDASEIYPKDWEITYDAFVEYRKNGMGGARPRAEIIKELSKHPKYLEFLESVKKENEDLPSYYDRATYLHELINTFGKPPIEQKKPKIRNGE